MYFPKLHTKKHPKDTSEKDDQAFKFLCADTVELSVDTDAMECLNGNLNSRFYTQL